ncbi:hypothetical protein O1611_g2809 [Lasiodiplodia mahajangana]|uniref:Uncharacterized protein n=1 Tax=Lasiodiplodia mahajangana TaxID=1108764 RepID=A0ACC2JTI4_9PEZI|nr:hypothetical protein O1611_g2809 [Lasiodiplodia mahajangana]
MEDGHRWKRRRLDRTEVAETTTNGSDPFTCTRGLNRGRTLLNIDTHEVTSRVSEIARVETNDLAGTSSVCYGMLENLPITSIPKAAIVNSPTLVPAYLHENGIVQRTSDGACVGKLEDRALQCLFKLDDEDGVHIQLMLKTVTYPSDRTRRESLLALAFAIIYGPEDLGDDVGDFLDRCYYVLQDPFSCHDKFTLSNSLRALETAGDLHEWPQPAALKTELHQHQKQALRFFIMRESLENVNHIWQPRPLRDTSLTYVNVITGSHQNVSPPAWNGGILADEMGLGKTLQMISLIAADRELQQQPREPRYSSAANSHRTTIVVVPLSLLSVWEYQLRCHLRPSTLSWGRHHGRSRLTSGVGSAYPDIILTTYQTVQAEYKHDSGRDSMLFQHRWRRIILDEAHIIRHRTVTSSAISALAAVSRWAITGTPIQNSFADIGGLLRFLRFPPYDNPRSFDEDIIEFFRRGDIDEGARRLKALCRPIMIRRPKTVIVLPTRQDLIKTAEFSDGEKRQYQKIENSLRELPNDAAPYPSDAHLSMSAIQLINKLRLFCNLGVCSITAPSVDEQTIVTTPESEGSTRTVVASELALGGMACGGCDEIIDRPDMLSAAVISPYAYYSDCCKLYCSSCASLSNYQTTMQSSCCKGTPCALQPLSPNMVQQAGNGQLPLDSHPAETSKVRALVREIKSCLQEKSVVFSFWTSSLSLVQKALSAAGIRCVRIDGSISLARREMVIQEFREDEEIKVILATISCGGVGLDLTAASRVHLLEPQWNPAVEEQALSRVHRMGQRRPVVTMRYVMKDSIEESVASVKGQKQLLVELLPQTAQRENIDE